MLSSGRKTMTTREHILDFYSRPGLMKSPGRHADLFDSLPNDVGALVGIVQGLALHEFVAPSFYGVAVSDERKSE